MAWVAVAVAGTSLVGSYLSSSAQEDAANAASNAQQQSAQLGVEEQRRQFDKLQELLQPYVQAGYRGLGGQYDLVGLNGAQSQQQAISALQSSPLFGALAKQGEDAILQNASATGGLRGGNVQAALAQFRPQLLSQLIDQQYSRLGGFTSLGQNAAAGVGNAGMQTGNQVSALLQQMGAAQAGAALAGGRAEAGMWNSLGGAVGTFAGLGGFRGFGGFGGLGGGTGNNGWTLSGMPGGNLG